jgi:hypothetical protein
MRLFPALAIVLCLLAGCSRARVTTEIRGGGAFTRTVALTGQEKKEGQMNLGDAIEDDFVLPSGEGWKSHNEKKDSNVTAIFERSFAAGAPVKGDLSIKGEGTTPVLVNEMTVARLAPAKFEYREFEAGGSHHPEGRASSAARHG